MEAAILKKYQDKRVAVYISSGYFYRGKLLEVTEFSACILDAKTIREIWLDNSTIQRCECEEGA